MEPSVTAFGDSVMPDVISSYESRDSFLSFGRLRKCPTQRAQIFHSGLRGARTITRSSHGVFHDIHAE